MTADAVVIASAAKQSIGVLADRLDCFATLAMTELVSPTVRRA